MSSFGDVAVSDADVYARFLYKHDLVLIIIATVITRKDKPYNKIIDYWGIEYDITKTCLSNIPTILPPKNDNFPKKILIFFHISAENIDCGYSLEPPRWGGSNEYPQSTFLSRNKKNNVYPCKPQFYYINVGFKGVKII